VILCTGQQSPFEGVWTSSYGYSTSASLYICVDPVTNILQGSYSNVGFIYGTVDDTGVFSGYWYEAGAFGSMDPGDPPSNGTLTLTVSNNTISGPFYYAGTNASAGSLLETRRTSTRPSDTQCLWSNQTAIDIQGYWKSESGVTGSICLTYPTSDGSYSTADGSEGYILGNCSLNATVCRYFWWEDTGIFGAILMRIIDTDTTIVWKWTGLIDSSWNFNSPLLIDTWTQTSDIPDGCGQNAYLRNSASVAAVSGLMILMLALAVLLFS